MGHNSKVMTIDDNSLFKFKSFSNGNEFGTA